MLVLFSSLHAEPYFEPSNPTGEMGCSWFDSLNVSFVGNWPLGSSYAIAADSIRNYIFLTSGGGILIFDASDPLQPVKLPYHIFTKGFIRDIHFDYSTQRIYIANEAAGIEIWDLTNISNPTKLGFFDNMGLAYYLDISNEYIYASDRFSIRALDISNPSTPHQVSSFVISNLECYSLYVKDTTLYLADRTSGLRIVNIADPTNPQEISTFIDSLGAYTDVDVYGNYLFLTDSWNGIRTINISNPQNPQQIALFHLPSPIREFYIHDSLAYVTADWSHFYVLDISRPESIQILGQCSVSAAPTDVAKLQSFVYLTDSYYGFLTIDMSDPSSPQEVGYYDVPGEADAVFVQNQFAYLVDFLEGLYIINVSDPSNPLESGYCELPPNNTDLDISGQFAYITNFDGFFVVDISNSSNPLEVGYCNTPGYDVSVREPYAFIASAYSGMRVINVQDPTNPIEVGYYDTPGRSLCIAVCDVYVFIADDDAGVRIVNISNPLYPFEVSVLDVQGGAQKIFISNHYAYIISGNSELIIADISDPLNVKPAGNFELHPNSNDLYVLRHFAYIANDQEICIVDVYDPQNPIEIGYYETPCYARGIFTAGSNVFVATSETGLQIYKNLLEYNSQNDITFKILQNPIQANRIKFLLGIPSINEVEISMYNIIGQKIATFVIDNAYSGIHEIEIPCPAVQSGIYFLRIENFGLNASEKVVIIE